METPPVIPDLSLLRRIGAGSYGDVWLARTLTGVYRAVKVVDRARFKDDRPFLRELDGISRFQRSVGDQPRQLALMHVGRLEEQGIFYYVMELADDVEAGTDIDPDTYEPLTLKALHEKRPELPASEVIRIGSDLARSLVGLHTAGLIHRDVKPSNIIFVAGTPKLADIGLVSSSDHTLTSLGTPGYSPPEGAGTVRADIYSLGKILYQLGTGLHTDEFPRLPPNVGEREDVKQLIELNEVFLKACAPNPQDRYESAQAMLDDLMLLHAGRSVRELNETRRRLKQLGRAALYVGAAAAIVIAILGVKNYFAVKALAAQEQEARIQAETDERLARYTSDLGVAKLMLDRGETGLARVALRRQIPASTGETDLRGPEWSALWSESEGDPSETFGEIGGPPVNGVALSENGRWLVAQVGESPRRVVAWDRSDGSRRDLLEGSLRLGGFVAEGDRVIVGMAGGGVRLVDPATGTVTTLPGLGNRVLQKPAGDGRTILLTLDSPTTFRLLAWDVATDAEVAAWEPEAGEGVAHPDVEAISRDRGLLAVSMYRSEGTDLTREILLWDFSENGYRFRRSDLGRARVLEFSPTGTILAAAGPGMPIHLLDTKDGAIIRAFPGHSGRVFGLEFSEDGSQITSVGEDQIVRTWDVSTGEMVAERRGHESMILDVAVDPGRQQIVTGSGDGTVRLWNADAPRRSIAAGGFWHDLLGDVLHGVDSSMIVATLASGRIAPVDADSLEPRSSGWDGAFHPLAIAGEELRALSDRRELVVVNMTSGDTRPTGILLDPAAATLVTAIASRDGRVAAIGLQDGVVEFWDCAAETRLPALNREHTRSIWALALSDDGRVAASGDRDGNVVIWSPQEGRLVRRLSGAGQPVYGLTLSGDGSTLVIGREGGNLTVVDTTTGAVLAETHAHTRGFQCAVFSKTADRLITGGSDGLVIFWSFPGLRQLAVLSVDAATTQGSDSAVYRMHLSPDGGELIALTEDGRLRRWHLESGRVPAAPSGG